ncbi:MAG: chromosome segregation protein SMC [Lachnospiraceae bacterium]|nr:chromosome segregation protein SMC [Lachnospiraceae bacterium]
MYLKSIEVNGFKSFANKINFKFNNGITGIVGPNGSGKSNVGDAVRWVLGEQSAKQLRGSKMEDVIFSGTELRKPQGSAYVAITLDNSDHKLPIDFNEVTIARRVYRSGESEYLINGVVSRLKDVNRLFFDTGIGKEGYSIIGQGQIERILSGKPEERRELFDEAAGIVKYKKNKAATEKQLEAERANLARVTDILKELEKQVGPLKEQSETARRYLIFKDELKKLDINAFLLDADNNKEQLKEFEEKLNIVEEDATRLRAEYDQAKDEYDEIEAKLESYNEKIDEAKNDIHEKKLINQKYEGEINLLNQQILSYRQNEDTVNEQYNKVTVELKNHQEELKKLYEVKAELDEKLDNADEVLDQATNKYEELKITISNKENEIESSKGDIIEFLNEGGTLKAKVGRYDTMLESLNLRKTQLNQKFLENKSEEEKFTLERNNLEQGLNEIDSSIADYNNQLAKVTSKLEDINRDSLKANEDITSFNNKIISLKSKKESLRNLTERYEGYGNSIKRVMEQKTNNPKIVGVVADIISVDKKYETAIETALGGSIQNIVTEDDITAKKMIEFLKQNKYGRATFLPINSIVDRSYTNNDATKEKGVIGIASTLVNSDNKYSTIINHLLGRIIVVDTIDNAIVISKKYKQSLRIVTLEGELINPGGAMTGGTFKNSSNLLGRKRELEEIDEEIASLKVKVEELSKLVVTYASDKEELKKNKEELYDKLQQLEIKKNTYMLNFEQANTKLDEIQRIYASISRENNDIASQITDIDNNKKELYDSNKKQEEAVKELEKRISQLEKELITDKSNLEKASENINSLNIDFNTVKQQYDFNMQNISRVRSEENNAKDTLNTLKIKLSAGNEEIQNLSNKIQELKAISEENLRIIGIKEHKLTELNQEKTVLNDSHKEFFKKREELSEQINGLDKSAFKLNASIEKISEKSENLTNYMWEEYELTYNMASEFKDDSLTDISALKREISAVKGKIKQLGDVNVNAIEDYKAVSERYEFLKTQHDDITKAEENLLGIIAELDRSMREQFAEKFKEIRIMFSKVFKELFGGGKADLELVDEEDILETGIKINAQPPGKKLQNMMQLSGGEKSLTAIALLFAIQSLKPSPFCLLDEIEAALDDSNVKRFAKYLNKLTKDTQFIVITHRKGTMEAADILYGITMQEKGVSTLVSVNMIENELDD